MPMNEYITRITDSSDEYTDHFCDTAQSNVA